MSDVAPLMETDRSEQGEVVAKLLRYRNLVPAPPPGVAARITNGGPDAADPDADAAALPVATQHEMAMPPVPEWPRLTPEEVADRELGCLLGLALGGAISGAMDGGGTAGRANTAAALCLAETLLCWGRFEEEDFLTRLQALPELDKAGLDAGTKATLAAYAARDMELDPGPDLETAAPGDGSLVRLAPLVILGAQNPDVMEVLAARQSRLTHPSREAEDACCLFASMLLDALSGANADAATRPRVMALCPKVLFISAGEWRTKLRAQLQPGSGAVGTLEAALWCVSRSGSTLEAIILAAELGAGVAALAGQLAGALHGASSIPEEWLLKLKTRARLTILAGELAGSKRF